MIIKLFRKFFLFIFFLSFSSICQAKCLCTNPVSYVLADESDPQFHTACPLPITPLNTADNNTFHVFTLDPSLHAQVYLGVGSSFEEATIYNLSIADPNQLKTILNKLFSNDEQSFNWNLMRVTWGTPDYTPRASFYYDSNGKINYFVDPHGNPFYYSYDDNNGQPDDNQLSHFNIDVGPDHLELKKILLINQAMDVKKAHNNQLLLLASAWSPPGWMKVEDPNNKVNSKVDGLIGGTLPSEQLDNLALYYKKTLEAYHNNGIDFYAMTELNEPCVGDATTVYYPNACISSENLQVLSIKLDNLLQQYNNDHPFSTITPKFWMHDFNLTGIDPQLVNKYDGIAFHSYYGSIQAIHQTWQQVPIGIYVTEFMTGFFNWEQNNFSANNSRILDAARLLEYFHQRASSYINWVTLQDDRMGPPSGNRWYSHNAIYTQDGKTYHYDFMDYALGSIAKFVAPGGNKEPNQNAYVLAENNNSNSYTLDNDYSPTDFSNTPLRTTDTGDYLPSVSLHLPRISQITFENPDHSLVTVLVNITQDPTTIKLIFPDSKKTTQYQIVATLPAHSIETIKWTPP